MHEAMALGANVVGGIPWIEFTDAEAQKHIEFCFDLARAHNADISMLLDDAGDASLRTLEMMATETAVVGTGGRWLIIAALWRCMRSRISSVYQGHCAGRRSPLSAIPTPARCMPG